MAKNEIAKSDKTMFPDMLKKSNFLISSVYRASLLENKVLALALTKVRLSDQGVRWRHSVRKKLKKFYM